MAADLTGLDLTGLDLVALEPLALAGGRLDRAALAPMVPLTEEVHGRAPFPLGCGQVVCPATTAPNRARFVAAAPGYAVRMAEPATPRPRWRRAGRLLAVALLGGTAAAGLLGTFAVTRADVGPGTVELRARLGTEPRTELRLPPFGLISAPTHGVPITLVASIERLDVEQVQDLVVADRPGDRLERVVEADLDGLVRSFGLRAGLVALGVGALTGALVPGRHWLSVLAGAIGGAAVVGALLGATWSGYDARAFEEARFEGPIERAPELIETAQRYVEDFESVRDRIQVLGTQLADLYASSTTERLASGPGERSILHVSDVHLNPIGLEVTRDLAEQFAVDAIIDTGDLTTFGNPLEARIGDLLAGMPAPYLFVPGNHDSFTNRSALARSDNLVVLDGEAVTVTGIEVLGVGDPIFTASNDVTDEERVAALADAAIDTRTLVRRFDPDVLAVHDPRLARAALGEVPLVVAGHVHETRAERIDGTLVLTVGSTGATGLGSFTVDADLAFEAEVLHFDDERLVAIDTIALQGTNGEFRIDRRLLDDEPPPGAAPS